MPESNKAEFNLKEVFDRLRTGIAVFQDAKLIEANSAARSLLSIDSVDDLGAYKDSLIALLKVNEDGYAKQLTGIVGKPLSATLHLVSGLQIVEINESFETKFGEASHELRRPLTNVKTLVDTLFLWGAGEDPNARKKFLAQLHNEVNRLAKLVDELLDLSRLRAGSIPLNFQQIALRFLVEESFSLLQEQADKNQIQLINEIPSNFVLIGDLDKLTHVVQNLIENAIRYNKIGGKVVVKPGNQPNSFTVQDTGSGIAEENIPLIFERFKRFNKEVPGTGLGLAIVKSIIDLHGGKLEVKSQLGIGTEFIAIIPKKKLVLPTV